MSGFNKMDVENGCNIAEPLADELCRLCANTDQQLIPIFQGEGIEHNIAEQIDKYLPIITVTQTDELPLKICYQCTSTLIAWHNFFEQCRGADIRLREILSVDSKSNQDDESCHDCTDNFHDDFEDQASINDNPQVECVLVESTDSDLQISTVSDAQIPIVSDAQIPIVSDVQIPIVSDVQVATVDDTQTVKTSDKDSIDVNKSVTETLNDSRSAESVEEKWDPLTKTPQMYSALLAEDRAKLVKRKKLCPLLRKCEEVDVIIFECDQCSAFFIDDSHFEKHKKTHANEKPNGETRTESSSPAKLGGFAEDALSTPKDGGETKRSDRQKLKLKIGSDVMTKKITVKKKSKIRELLPTLRSSRSTKMESSRNSFESRDGHAMGNSGNNAKRKRKLASTKSEELRSCPTKKKKKEAEHDESGSNCRAEDTDCEPEANSSAVDFIRVAILAEEGFSDDEAASGNADRKSERPNRGRCRRVQRDDDDDDAEKGEETFTCAHCLRSFGRKSNLKRHMMKLHFPAKKSAGDSSSKWFTGYCCDVCGEGLQHRPTMMAHRDVLHGAHPEMDWAKYRTSLARVKFCLDCKRYFRSGSVFEEHDCDRGKSIEDASLAQRVRSAEEARPRFVCSVCDDCFRWKWDYRLHRETEHSDATPVDWVTVLGSRVPHLCEQCFKGYPSADELAEHACAAEQRQQVPSDEAKKQYRCELCLLEYFWKSDYRRHMRLKHPMEHYPPTEHDSIVYSCPYCADKFTLKRGILQHMRKAHKVNSDSPFVCVKCNKVFRRRDNLDRHNKSYHPAVNDDEARRILNDAEIRINGDTTYHCAICSRNIADSDRFVAHYQGHKSDTKFKCDLCDKQTRTQHQLNTHIKNIHLNIRNYRCDLCEKSFYSRQSCEEHRRIHTGERPFSCEICGKTFVAGNALISHKRFHNDFYPHPCHLCDKKFKVRRSLINHIRTHTGERPFECDLCAKTFNNKSQYSYHKKVTHSKDRPFVCSVCGSGFKANKFLVRHMELHDSSQTAAQPRKTKRKSASWKAPAAVGEDEVVTIGPAPVIAGDIVAERGIKIFVSTPASVSTAARANVPSIVNVQIHDENILPESNLFDAPSDYEQFEAKSTEICDSNPAAFMTTLEYIQVTDGEYKPVISGETYVTLQPDSSHDGAGAKNLAWL